MAATIQISVFLCTLAKQPGKLTKKEDLLDAIWGHRHVSESVLKAMNLAALKAAYDRLTEGFSTAMVSRARDLIQQGVMTHAT